MQGPTCSSAQPRPHPDGSRELWALFYASRGWPVLPLHSAEKGRCSCGDPNCGSAGKHPRTQHGVKDASKDPEQIHRWWRLWPDANVGIATGVVSGILVVDIDPRNGGEKSYEQLQNELPDAFTTLLKVRTGSGGAHLYFECLSPTPCRTNIRPGIDIKADGGYVVAPSSWHVSGTRYRFVSNSGLVVPPLPTALRDLILGWTQAHVASGEEPPKLDIDRLRVSAEIKNQIRAGAPKGKRSEAIFAAIRAMIKAGHSNDEIRAVLMDPANSLSEKPRDKGLAWLTGEVTRARAKPDRDNSSKAQLGDSNNTSQTKPGSNRVLISRRAAEVQPEAIRWLWPERIALGKNSLIAGQPGLGKSQITTYLAAITSSGGTWSTGEVCAAGDVLLLSAEDDPADTIRPRLEACGANLDRVHIIEAVRHAQRERAFNLKGDLEALAAKLKATPGAKLVTIDPISAYLGDIDSHNNSAVRGVLAPLAKLASDHGVAVVSVTHLTKDPSADPLTRVIGSTAFGAAVRTAFLIAPDKVSPERRLFLPLKSNISRACSGLAFHIESHSLPSNIETSRVVWEAKPVIMTASEALSLSTQDEIDDAKEVTEACLRVFDTENATEFRASRLTELLWKHETLLFTPKQLKRILARCGISHHKRSDANYYLKADFVPQRPPSLHSSIVPSSSMQQERKFDSKEGVEAVERVEGVEAVEDGRKG